jgi:hypothetical protein
MAYPVALRAGSRLLTTSPDWCGATVLAMSLESINQTTAPTGSLGRTGWPGDSRTTTLRAVAGSQRGTAKARATGPVASTERTTVVP